ncbi:MAG: hypothetical protein P8X96_07225 [Desulfobacteraceae bacterium]
MNSDQQIIEMQRLLCSTGKCPSCGGQMCRAIPDRQCCAAKENKISFEFKWDCIYERILSLRAEI